MRNQPEGINNLSERERGRDNRLQWIDSDRLIEKVSFRVKELGMLLLATGKDLLAYVLV